MARSDKEKGSSIYRDRKIQKLGKMIKAKERELELVEIKIERAKGQVSKGDMSKGDYQRLHIQLSRNRKAVNAAITKLRRTRVNREHRLKEKAAQMEEREKERRERREDRALKRQLKREEKAGKDAGED
jgi:hypothetical protein